MQINLVFDPSVSSAPTGFTSAVRLAADFFDKAYADPITVTINVGWGEVGGQAIDPGNLGQSNTSTSQVSFSQLIGALKGDATTSTDQTADLFLPTSDPTAANPAGPGTYKVALALGKALKIDVGSGTPDGYVGFDANSPYTFDPYNRAVPGKYDFIAVAEHEISEVLGRASRAGTVGNNYRAIDLYRYSSDGQRQLTSGDPSYFSINGGATNLGNFNNPVTGNSGDLADWAGQTPYFPDSFNDNSNPGVLDAITPRDVIVMDAIGYDFVQPAVHFVGISQSTVGNWNDATFFNGNLSGTAWQDNTGHNTAIPSFNDDAFIDAPYQVTLNGNDLSGKPVAVDSLNVASGAVFTLSATLQTGTGQTNNGNGIVNSGKLNINGGQLTDLGNATNTGTIAIGNMGKLQAGGTWFNSGAITLQGVSTGNGGADQSFLVLNPSGLTLRGNGSVTFLPGNNWNEITGSGTTTAAPAVLHNVDNKISGGGVIGNGVGGNSDGGFALALDNQDAGIVNANDKGSPLYLQHVPTTNTGIIEATGGATLNLLDDTIVQKVGTNSTLGVIGASDPGSVVSLNGKVVIAGGQLSAQGGGNIRTSGVNNGNLLDGSTAAGAITNLGLFTVNNLSNVAMKGEIANKSVITLTGTSTGNGGGDQAIIDVGSSGLTLDGGGSVILADGNQWNEITGFSASTVAVLNNVDNTISGTGSIGNGVSGNSDGGFLLFVQNQANGKIIANSSQANAPLVLGNRAIAAALPILNVGLLEAAGNAHLQLQNATVLQVGGTIKADGADARVELRGATIIGGTIDSANSADANGAKGITETVSGLNTLDGSTVSCGPINIAGDVLVQDITSLHLKGTIHNAGSITLFARATGNGGGDQTLLFLDGTDLFLDGGASGTGRISMQGTLGGNGANEITGNNATTPVTLHNSNHTIFGAGTIGNGVAGNADGGFLLTLDNQAGGVIEAEEALPLRLGNFDAGTKQMSVSNGGVIEAVHGAQLVLANVAITGSGKGIIGAGDAGSHIDLDHDVTLTNTTMDSAGGAVFKVTGGITHPAGVSSTDVLDTVTLLFGEIQIPDIQALRLKGTITNNGSISLNAASMGNGGGDQSFLLIDSGDVTLTGNGSVLLNAGNSWNEITGFSSTAQTTLHNVDNHIAGAGTIGHGVAGNDDGGLLLTLDNQKAGTVTANVAGAALTLNGLTVNNAGVLEATSGGVLSVTGNAVINQSSSAGVIQAVGNTSRVDLNNATINGGQLLSSGGGLFKITGGTDLLDGSTAAGAITNNATVQVGDILSLHLHGAIHNNGNIGLFAASSGNGGGDQTFLIIDADGATIDGAGAISLAAGNSWNEITGFSSATSTTLNNASTIAGTGWIGHGVGGNSDGGKLLTLNNQSGGKVDATIANAALTVNTGATVANDGILEAEGGTLVVNDAVTNNNLVTSTAGGTVVLNGAVSGKGTLKADGGTLTVNGDAAFGATAVITNGGTLQALGNFQANVSFQGAGMLVLPEVAITQGGYIGRISGWASNDTLDITSLPFKSSYDVFVGNGGNGVQGLFVRDTAAMDSAGNPQIVAELLMNGSLVSRNFSVADDKHGGTVVSEHDAGPVPVPSGLTLAPISDTGTPGDNVTTVRTPTITGTGEAGDTVTLLDGTAVLGSATVDPKGNWAMTLGTPLAIGQHSLTATEADPNGVASSASAALPLTILSKAVNDFDGDGKSGLLWRNTGSQDPNLLGTVSVWEAIAPDPQKPGFVQTTNAQNVALVGTDWKIVGTGDVNADGKTDVLWRNIGQDPSLSGAVSVWEMNGFKTAVADYLRGGDGNPVQVPLDLSVFGTPDVNGDGMSDILWRNLAGTVEVTLLNGTSTIETDAVQTVGTDFSIVGSGDFDGDRKGDILWRNNDGTVAIWEMNGGQIKAAQNIALPSFVASNPTAWSIPVTADYDGDGKTDILWRKSDGTVGMSLMNGFQSRGDAVLGTVPMELINVAVADINGDGRADVVWRNSAGSVEVSLVNGGGFIETDTIEPNPVGTEYSIVGQPQPGNDTFAGALGGLGSATASIAATAYGGTNAGATAAAQSIAADIPTTVAGAANVGAGPTSVAGIAASVTGSQPAASMPQQPAAGSTTVSGGADNPAPAGSQSGFAVAGNVTVWGGAGVSGQGGAGQGAGNATVTGFGPSGGNGISFPNETPTAVNQVITSARTANGSTMLTLPDGSTLTLAGVAQVDSRIFR